MARYKLTAPHYIDDRLLGAGTEIGDGTAFPYDGEPSLEMEGMDEESKGLIRRRFSQVTGGGPVDSLPIGADTGAMPPNAPRLEMVGKPQSPPQAAPAFVRDDTNQPSQPIQPYAIEQTSGSAVAQADFGKAPEDRQQDADSIAGTKTAGAILSGPQTTDTPPSTGNNNAEEPKPATTPTLKSASPTLSGRPTTTDKPK